jgi:hypothetical protein
MGAEALAAWVRVGKQSGNFERFHSLGKQGVKRHENFSLLKLNVDAGNWIRLESSGMGAKR